MLVKYKIFLSPLFFLIICCDLFGQSSLKNTDELFSNNAVLLNSKIDSLFKFFNDKTPGVAVSVYQNGKLITRKTYGMASIEHQIPFVHHSPVRLGYSGSREFMSAALALMEEEGLLRFDDKVSKYFPLLPA